MNHSARRINALSAGLGARRYLEIGVAQGVTFRDVAVAHRTAVDPAFQFDTASLANQRTRFLQFATGLPWVQDQFNRAARHTPYGA